MTPDQITAAQALLWRAIEAGDLHQQRVAASAELWRQDLRALGIEPRQLLNPLAKSDKPAAEESSVSAAIATSGNAGHPMIGWPVAPVTVEIGDQPPVAVHPLSESVAAATDCRTCAELRDKLTAAERMIESFKKKTREDMRRQKRDDETTGETG